MRRLFALSLLSLVFTPAAFAVVRFEAYYAVDVRGKPGGVSVQRDEVDATTQERTTSYLLKTTPVANDLEQFVRIRQSSSYRPLSYEFKSSVRKQRLDTRGVVRGDVMRLTLDDGRGAPEIKEIPLTRDTFFSASLGPLLAREKPAKGQAYSFEAFLEEDRRTIDGEVLILDQAQVGPHRVYRTILRYLELEFEIWFLDDGTAVATQSTKLPTKSYLVADPGPLLGDVEVPAALLAKYFGAAPRGKLNAMARGDLKIPKDGLFKQKPDLRAFENVKRTPIRLAH